MYRVLVCVDDREDTKALCDGGVFFAKHFGVKVTLFHAIEHSDEYEKDLSGRLVLNSKDNFMQEVLAHDEKNSKENIVKSKELLARCQRYFKDAMVEVEILHMHGKFEELVKKQSGRYKMVVLGKQSKYSGIKTILKNIHTPVFLLKNSLEKASKVLIAYDGSNKLDEILMAKLEHGLFKTYHHTVVHVGTDDKKAKEVLEKAKKLFLKYGIEVVTSHIHGDKDTFVSYVNTSDSDIVVMGAYSSGFAKHMLFGSFTNHMLDKLDKSILILK